MVIEREQDEIETSETVKMKVGEARQKMNED